MFDFIKTRDVNLSLNFFLSHSWHRLLGDADSLFCLFPLSLSQTGWHALSLWLAWEPWPRLHTYPKGIGERREDNQISTKGNQINFSAMRMQWLVDIIFKLAWFTVNLSGLSINLNHRISHCWIGNLLNLGGQENEFLYARRGESKERL